jgi:hypothetical protein
LVPRKVCNFLTLKQATVKILQIQLFGSARNFVTNSNVKYD